MVENIRIGMFVKPLLLLLLLLGAGWLVWDTYFNKTDKRMIQEQLYKFSSNASKYSGEGMAQGLLKCKALESIFDKNCHVNINLDMFTGSFAPEEISSKAMFLRNQVNSAVIGLHNANIEIDGDKAEAVLTASLDGESRSGKRFNEYRELIFFFKKDEGKWLVYKIDIHQILEK